MIDPYTRQERGPSPAAVLLEQHRHRLTAARRRSGLAQTQLLILGAVIAAIIVLSVGGFAVYRSVTRGAEDNATKTNIDRVLAAAEDYWQQFALDRSGVRSIPFTEWCNYANSQFTIEDDLTLRTFASTAGAPGTAGTKTALADVGGVGNVVTTGTVSSSGNRANCAAVDAGDDVHKFEAFISTTATATSTSAMSAWRTQGLGNTRAVFLLGVDAATHVPSGATPAAADRLPPGTKVPAAAKVHLASERNTVIVVGAVSSSGNSFCAVKVFDADDRSHIGNYRFSSAPVGGNPVIAQECLDGSAGIVAGTDADGGWKAAS